VKALLDRIFSAEHQAVVQEWDVEQFAIPGDPPVILLQLIADGERQLMVDVQAAGAEAGGV
jgi:hypothetical protein